MHPTCSQGCTAARDATTYRASRGRGAAREQWKVQGDLGPKYLRSLRESLLNIVLVIGVCLRSYHRRVGAATADGRPGDPHRLAMIASIQKGGDGRTEQRAREYRQQ